MSLPAGFLDELRARASIAQVAGRKVSWDQKKTNMTCQWTGPLLWIHKTAYFEVL